MSEQQIEQLHENTQNISDARNAFDTFRDIEFKKFKDNLSLIIAGGGILWAISSFVFKTNTAGANNHNDIVAQTANFKKEMDDQREHFDKKLNEIADSMSAIRASQSANNININRRLDRHENSLKSLNEKCDRIYGSGGFVNKHTDKNGKTTFIPAQ